MINTLQAALAASKEPATMANLTQLQARATLALADEQRTANLLAYLTWLEMRDNPAADDEIEAVAKTVASRLSRPWLPEPAE